MKKLVFEDKEGEIKVEKAKELKIGDLKNK